MSAAAAAPSPLVRVTGRCHVFIAFDAGFSINLQLAESRISAQAGQRRIFQHKRRVLTSHVSGPPPLRVLESAEPLQIGTLATEGQVETALFDFGAVCTRYALPIDGELENLVHMGALLYDSPALVDDARRRATALVLACGDAVRDPGLSELAQDYVVFRLDPEHVSIPELAAEHAETLARILRAETGRLSRAEIDDALASRIAYGASDVTFVDWFAALLVGKDMDDERQVLEFATVELAEMCHLDALLAKQVDEAYDVMARARTLRGSLAPRSQELGRIAMMRADSAVLHEGFANAFKLLGDDYLARLYRLASARFHFRAWDESIERKLKTLESIYETLSDFAGRRRSEMLEWLIILLIAVDIVLYFTPLRR